MVRSTRLSREERLQGLLLGTAVGDSLGLPAEGLSSRRIKKWFSGDWRHRFLLGHGMVSDDTEHTIFVAQCLLSSPQSPTTFQHRLAWRFRFWLLLLPAGIGYATLRAILKLWLGFSSAKSGVYSAGNGAAMRSAIIGAYFSDHPQTITEYVNASTCLTHTDPRALIGALAIAHLAAWVCRNQINVLDAEEIFALLQDLRNDEEWQVILCKMKEAWKRSLSVSEFAAELNLSRAITGYVYHTVPMAIYSWMRHYDNFDKTLTELFRCGGDTDTAGAIAGALAGATVGECRIPKNWLNGIVDFPISCGYIRVIARQLANQNNHKEDKIKSFIFWLALVPRNFLFLLVILFHGIRRLLPPY